MPATLLARVNAANRTLSMTAALLGVLAGGAIAQLIDLRAPLWLSGAALTGNHRKKPAVAQRTEIIASPLRLTAQDLAGPPPAFVIVDENDVLHDFMMLDPRHGRSIVALLSPVRATRECPPRGDDSRPSNP